MDPESHGSGTFWDSDTRAPLPSRAIDNENQGIKIIPRACEFHLLLGYWRRILIEMPTLIAQPTRIQAAGTKPKLIDEFVGRVNSKTDGVSVAHMRSPAGLARARTDAGVRRVHHRFEGDGEGYAQGRLDGGAPGPGCDCAQRRVDPVLNPRGRRRRVHRGMPAGILNGDGTPGLKFNGYDRQNLN